MKTREELLQKLKEPRYKRIFVSYPQFDNNAHPAYCVDLEREDGTTSVVLTEKELTDLSDEGIPVYYAN